MTADQPLPKSRPENTCALIVGLSRPAFHRRYVIPGKVERDARNRITLMSLVRAWGRPITATMLFEAEQKLDATTRAYQRRYAARRRTA